MGERVPGQHLGSVADSCSPQWNDLLFVPWIVGQDRMVGSILALQATPPLPHLRLQTRDCTKASWPSRCIATSDQSLDGDAGDGPLLTVDRGWATGLVELTPLVRTYVAWGTAASCSHWYPAFLLIIIPASSDYLHFTEEKMKDQRGYLPHTAICPTSKGGLFYLSNLASKN